MKIGMRKPSYKKSFKARTTGKMKRKVKRAVNPLYGKKGMGWVNNPKKAAYNKIYRKTTFGVNDVIRAASVLNSSSTKKSTKKRKTTYSTSSYSDTKKNQFEGILKEFNVDTKLVKRVRWCLIMGGIFILAVNPVSLIAAAFPLFYAVKTIRKEEYIIASSWYTALKYFVYNDYEKSKKYLSKLPEHEKETAVYKMVMDVLNGDTSAVARYNNGGYETGTDNVEKTNKEDKYYYEKLSIKNEKVKYTDKVFDEFIVIDTETTGLDCSKDKIIEVSALKYKDGQLIDSFERLINPEIEIPQFITDINHITNDMVKDKDTIDKVMPELLDFIGNSALAAHNAKFDIRYIDANLVPFNKKTENEIIDTLTLSRYLYKDIANHKLPTIKEHLNMNLESHRASTDCMVCAQIYLDYCKTVKENSKLEDADEVEVKVYEVVQDMLIRNNVDLTYFKAKKTGVYLDFTAFYTFLRMKLNGKKQYILTNLDSNLLEELGLTIEAPSKSENYKNRVNFESLDTLIKLESYIVEAYKKTLESVDEYTKVTKKAQDNVYKYLLEG